MSFVPHILNNCNGCPDLPQEVIRIKRFCEITAHLHLAGLATDLRITESGYYKYRRLLLQLSTKEPYHLKTAVIRHVYINYEIGRAHV